MVLPRFVTAAMHSKPLIVHDDGQQQRCFAHVYDVIDAIVALMSRPEAYVGFTTLARINRLRSLPWPNESERLSTKTH